MVVLDASAVLAWAFNERGGDTVEAAFSDAVVPAPNWAEVLQKVVDRGHRAKFIGDTILNLGLSVVPVGQDDAERAAAMWERTAPLSLGDRFCLAVGQRLDVPIWTCDRSWASVDDRVVVLR